MLSKVIRQSHMYAALFVAPWLIMYGLSTFAMNHRAFFKQRYGGALVRWLPESEQIYAGRFSPGAEPRLIAEQILRDLRLEGNYNVNLKKSDGALTIVRTDPIAPKRITYHLADRKLAVEKQEFRVEPFLESLHRRRGYQSDYALDDAWAVSVDLAIAAMVFWVLSGLWMWWELKVTRLAGALCLAGGLAIFIMFVVTI
jgi:hypothetical protein